MWIEYGKCHKFHQNKNKNNEREGKEKKNVILLTFHSTYHLYVCLVYNYKLHVVLSSPVKYSKWKIEPSCEIENKFNEMTQLLFSLHNKRQHKQNI